MPPPPAQTTTAHYRISYPALEALPLGVGYLEKPFSLADLRQRVRESLDEPVR